MPISIDKGSGPEASVVYCIQVVAALNGAQVVVRSLVYETVQRLQADFLPIIQKQRNLTDPALVAQVESLYSSNYDAAIQAIEQWLIANDPWYQGGSIVAPAVVGTQG